MHAHQAAIAIWTAFTLSLPLSLAAKDFPEFDDPHLQKGRTIWVENCMTCHGYGVAGAPVPTDASAWEMRVKKDINVLYTHALEGFFGPDDTMMPPRGGNDQLTDNEVKSAVDYMVNVAKHTLNAKH